MPVGCVARSREVHPLDELLSGPAFQQRVGDPVDVVQAGQVMELPVQLARRVVAELPGNLSSQEQHLTHLPPVSSSLSNSPAPRFLDQLVQASLKPVCYISHRLRSSPRHLLRLVPQF